VACLALAVYNIDLGEVMAILGTASLPWLVAGVGVVVLSTVAKAVRWRVLFRLEGDSGSRPPQPAATVPGIPRLTNIWMAGAALNLALPTPRSGDLARAYLAGEAGSMSKSLVLGTVAAEKLLDMVMLALCFLALVPLVPLPAELAQRQRPVIGLAIMALVVVALVLWQRQLILAQVQRLLSLLPGRWGKPLFGTTERAVQGLDALRHPRLILLLLLWTAGIWLLATVVNYMVLLSLHLPQTLGQARWYEGWVVSLFVLVVLQAGVVLPSTPGKIGVFQVLCRWALGVFGIPASVGLAYGILLYLVAPGSQIVLGALALAWEGWRLRHSPARLGPFLAQEEEAISRSVQSHGRG
jgi:hypothetical protein